jgi:predicted GNAT family N-acyltransferase
MIEVIKITGEEQLKEAFKIRHEVFVDEQHVDPELEYDEYEDTSNHYLALADGRPAGTARFRKTGKGVKLERFAVLQPHRGTGVGKALVERVINDVMSLDPAKIYLHAQMQVIPFYEKYGFEASGEIFEEAGILHRIMYYKQERPL